MKKTMESAYTDMMTNLAKSTSAIPLHLQPAVGALAWWESSDSLLAKSELVSEEDVLAKSSAEHETDEAYEEDAEHGDPREESNAENDVHGGDGSEEEGDDEEEEGEMEKSLGALEGLSNAMLAKGKKSSDRVGDQFLPGQVEMFEGMSAPKKESKLKGPVANPNGKEDPKLKKALDALNETANRVMEKSMGISPIAASRGVTPMSRKMMLQRKYPHVATDAAREELDRADDQGVVTPAMPKMPSLIKS